MTEAEKKLNVKEIEQIIAELEDLRFEQSKKAVQEKDSYMNYACALGQEYAYKTAILKLQDLIN